MLILLSINGKCIFNNETAMYLQALSNAGKKKKKSIIIVDEILLH